MEPLELQDKILGVMELSGEVVKNPKKLTDIAIIQVCTREREFGFLLDSASMGVIDDIRYKPSVIEVKAKFFFDNKDKSSELLDKFSSNMFDKLSRKKMRLFLSLKGSLNLICQRCGKSMGCEINNKTNDEFGENYILASNKLSIDNNLLLDSDKMMEIFCDKNRLNLVDLAKQELSLCIDMFPKHEVC